MFPALNIPLWWFEISNLMWSCVCFQDFVGLFWLPLWYSGQSSWLQVQRPGFDSLRYQISWEVVGLEWGSLSLSTIEELLERQSSGSGLENWEYSYRDLLLAPHGTFYPQKLALTSPKSFCRSVGIVHTRSLVFSWFKFSCLHPVACTRSGSGVSV
jgi:hypothetical protein